MQHFDVFKFRAQALFGRINDDAVIGFKHQFRYLDKTIGQVAANNAAAVELINLTLVYKGYLEQFFRSVVLKIQMGFERKKAQAQRQQYARHKAGDVAPPADCSAVGPKHRVNQLQGKP